LLYYTEHRGDDSPKDSSTYVFFSLETRKLIGGRELGVKKIRNEAETTILKTDQR